MRNRTLAFFAFLTLLSAAQAQSTAFTYQGRLKNGSAVAAGLHDFRFRLWDAAAAGTQFGSTQCVDNILVSEDLFNATIDFGQQYVSSSPRFLVIEVRADTGLTCATSTGFVILGPRQPLTATPLASSAKSAFSLAAPDGTPLAAVSVDNDGRVGIGTTTPLSELHIAGGTAVFDRPNGAIRVTKTLGLLGSDDLGIWNRSLSGSQPFAIADWNTGTKGIFLNTASGDVGIGTASPSNLLTVAGNTNITGNLGIGFASPQAKLDVRGDIRLGSFGEYLAPGVHEDLRVVRGTVSGGGGIVAGTGFTLSQSAIGDYLITFTPAFASAPTLTATCDLGTNLTMAFTMTDDVTAGSGWIATFNPSGNSVDCRFSFIAIGPR